MAAPRTLIGTELDGRYRIVRRIGAGGFGTVWEAIVRSNGARVAVKTLSGELADKPDASARFRREARAASSIFHPSIVRTLDLGVSDDGVHYLVMELLRGATLAEVCKGETMPVPEALAVLGPLLEALVAAHGAGVVHRDLKPENVYLHLPVDEDGVDQDDLIVKIVDFGVSKMRGSDSLRATGSGVMIGTLFYMAPEQARGVSDVDGRADIYAAGALAYEMLTGQRPFNGRDAQQVISQILRDKPTPIAELSPSVPPSLIAWIERAMMSDREERFQSAAIALRALRDTIRQLELEDVVDAASGALRTRVLNAKPELLAAPTLSLPPLAEHEPAPSTEPPPLSEPPKSAPISSGPRKSAPKISPQRYPSRDRVLALLAGSIGALVALLTAVAPLASDTRTYSIRSLLARPAFGMSSAILASAWAMLAWVAPSARARMVARPITLMAWAQAINLAYQFLQWGANPLSRKLPVIVIGEGASLWALPAGVHVTMLVLGARGALARWTVRFLYGGAFVLMALSWSKLWATRDEHGFVGGPLLTAMLVAGAVGVLYTGFALLRASQRTVDVERGRRVAALGIGISAYFGLELLDVVVFLRTRVYPQTLVKLIPLGFIAYGALGADLLATGGAQRMLRWGSRTLRTMIGLGVTVGAVLAGREAIGLPDLQRIALPAASSGVALFLAWQSLSVDEATPTTLATGAVMMLLGFLKLDIALLAVVRDPIEAIWISRIDHLFFTFMPFALVIVSRRVVRWTNDGWLIWLMLAAALLVSPLALGEGYFPTTAMFWFGRFAQAGPVYMLYQPLQSFAIGYSMVVIGAGALRESSGRRRGLLFLLAGCITAAAMLLLGESRTTLGAPVYPYGNFMIISIMMITYGVLYGELAEFGTVVRASVAHGFVSALVGGLLAAVLAGVARSMGKPSPAISAGVAALVMIIALEPARQRAQALVDRWLGTDRFDGADAFRAFAESTSGLSRANDVADAARRVLEQTCAPASLAVLLPADDGGFARGPFATLADEPAVLEVRKTSDIVRCGPGTSLPTPAGLSRWHGNVVLVPALHRGRMLGLLAIEPSARAPLRTRRAGAFLRAFAEHIALVLENLALHASVEAAVEQRTSELGALVVKLEARLAAMSSDDEARARLLAELRIAADAARGTATDPAARREAEAALAMLERLIPRRDGRPSSGNVRAARRV